MCRIILPYTLELDLEWSTKKILSGLEKGKENIGEFLDR